MIALPAPILYPFAVGTEAVFALGQGEDGLTGRAGRFVVAGVTRAIEGIHLYKIKAPAKYMTTDSPGLLVEAIDLYLVVETKE